MAAAYSSIEDLTDIRVFRNRRPSVLSTPGGNRERPSYLTNNNLSVDDFERQLGELGQRHNTIYPLPAVE